MFVKAGKQDITERASRDTLIAILQGAVFKSNGKTYRVLGNAGNINLEAKMLGNKVNKHWKNLYYWEKYSKRINSLLELRRSKYIGILGNDYQEFYVDKLLSEIQYVLKGGKNSKLGAISIILKDYTNRIKEYIEIGN